MKSILFVDGVTPKAYTHYTPLQSAIGGTEASVGRVGLILSKSVTVGHLQRNRDVSEILDGIQYDPLDTILPIDPDIVITLRDATIYRDYIEKYPKAKHYLWLHDVVAGEYRDHLTQALQGLDKIEIISVSKWHAFNIMSNLPYLTPHIKIHPIYLPLADYCTRTNVTYDHFKLVFFSSPHKGLPEVLGVFNEIYKLDDRFRLIIANPGYYPNADSSLPGVENRGTLSHTEILDEVRTALCTLYCQTSFEETFGLVMAESMAVGTPPIVHPLGASDEIVDHPNCLLNCRDVPKVVNTVLRWSKGERPTVAGSKYFQSDTVAQEWKKLFNK